MCNVQKVLYFIKLYFILIKFSQQHVRINSIILFYISSINLGIKFDKLKNCDKTKIKKLLEKKKYSPNKKIKTVHSPVQFHLNSSGSNSLKNNSNLKKGKSFTENNRFVQNFNSFGKMYQKSDYNLSKLKKDFKRSRIYKKISCEFPSINFISKRKKKAKQNYGLTPKTCHNLFNDVRFKPFTPCIEEDSKKDSSFNKKSRKKLRNLKFLHKNKSKNKDKSQDSSKVEDTKAKTKTNYNKNGQK